MKNSVGHLGGDLMGRSVDALVSGANEVRDFERSLIRLQIATDGNEASTRALRSTVKGAVKGDIGQMILAELVKISAATNQAANAPAPIVQLGDNQVSRSAAKGTDARRGTQ